VPFELTDVGALGDGLSQVRGTGGQVWLTVAPQRQPMVERKGFLGRRRQAAAAWCLAAQDWAGSGEPAEWTLWCVVPPGRVPGRHGVALPAGAVVETESDDDALVRLPVGTAEATMATELCRLAGALVAPQAPGGWFWCVGDSARPHYDVDFWDV
jgi:hypothetical protein